ncbi:MULTISPECIES: NfeD family protein [unclassified Bacillus (in: firmicutes)]|uniref:NfeD family protein n=1 Tax=unclassified Bacillus (in: firmicutes) TaxID=185979 RepID=UPI002280B9B5|nr:NfeD family protein [Bacillus sp. S20C3]MCY8204619.1 NfeD family protein [Bacillus sp. N12A5]MCY8290510.1 NfeD family protein [Bacillus sp. N13C7]MCY8639433.1 NfeD family protein [Bacillus sp. S17B2]MCY8720148.1 NfeD family protein [Bacillus sp. S10C12M]MCY9145956.1 NfeD family protein [Bacillus sp. T9C1]
MELLDVPIQTIYLYTLMIAGSLTLLFLFFGDVFSGLTEGIPFLNPTLVLAFFTCFSAGGYIGELTLPLSSLLIALLSCILSIILVTLLHIFVLVPLSSAEESLAYKEDDLRGRIGKVITAVPVDGFGEVVIEGIGGTISKSAVSFENQQISYGTTVLVVDVNNGVLSVTPHEPI